MLGEKIRGAGRLESIALLLGASEVAIGAMGCGESEGQGG